MDPLAYVTNTDSDDISVVNLKLREETARVSIGGSPRGSVRFDPRKVFGYVSNCAGNTISVLDLSRNREVARVQVGAAPRGLTLSTDGSYAYVSNSGDNTLSVVDLVARKEVRRIAMGENPRHMTLIPGGDRLLVTQWGSDSVAYLDLSTDAGSPRPIGAARVGSGSRPYSVVATGDGKTALVANTQADFLSVVDVMSAKERTRVQIGFGGRAAVLSVDERFAFVSIENSNEVAIVELDSMSLIRKLEVGPSPRGVALCKTLSEIYSSNFTRSVSPAFGDVSRNTLTVINVQAPLEAKVEGHIAVGLGPCSVSVLE